MATLRIVAGTRKDLSAEEFDQMLEWVLRDPDPEALFEVGNFLASAHGFGDPQASARYADYIDANLGQYAWQSVACRRGGTTLCASHSPLVDQFCMNGGICLGLDYERMLRAGMSPADQALLDRQIARIERLLSGGRG